jgi:hypothetical protein
VTTRPPARQPKVATNNSQASRIRFLMRAEGSGSALRDRYGPGRSPPTTSTVPSLTI